MDYLEYIKLIPALLLALVALAEIVVRFTKTEKDDGFVQRVGSIIKRVLDVFKVPNRKL